MSSSGDRRGRMSDEELLDMLDRTRDPREDRRIAEFQRVVLFYRTLMKLTPRTFATPTILAGDRSLVSLVAHELAHRAHQVAVGAEHEIHADLFVHVTLPGSMPRADTIASAPLADRAR